MNSVPVEVWLIGAAAAVMAAIRMQIGVSARRAAATDVRSRHWAPYTVVGLVVAGVAAGMIAKGLGGSLLLSWLAGINLVAIAFYGWDKLAALLAVARVPERSLHLLALAGGTAGALVAQGLFHHKTSKSSFHLTFWAVVSVQVLLLAVYANTQNA